MADTEHVKSDCHWVAIDVARYWNAVLIETASGERHRFRMANSAEDFDRLIEFLRKLGGRCCAALEPTGDYHRPIAYRLLQAGVEVSGISSVAQSRYREAMFNSWDKNDPKDAGVIRLNQEVVRVLNTGSVKEKFFSVGAEIVGSTPDQLARVNSDIAMFGKVIKDIGRRN